MKNIKIIALALAILCILPVFVACSEGTADSVELADGEIHNSQTIYYVEAARYDAAGNPSVVYVYLAADSGSDAKDIESRFFDPETSSNYFIKTSYEVRKIIEEVETYQIAVNEKLTNYEFTYYTFSDFLYYDLDSLKATMEAHTVEKSKF